MTETIEIPMDTTPNAGGNAIIVLATAAISAAVGFGASRVVNFVKSRRSTEVETTEVEIP